MSYALIVYKNRTNVVAVSLGIDVSEDTITSEIREDKDSESDLIATWSVDFLTDGVDGELILKIDNTEASNINVDKGYMDLKRVSAGEPLSVFDSPLRVVFRDTVTA